MISNLICIFLLLSVSCYVKAVDVVAQKKQLKPFEVMPFVIPKVLESKIQNYRSRWIRLTGFEYSGLHWGQFVVIFVNKGAEIYKNNYLAYLQNYGDEDDEDEDENEEQFFELYKPGTIFVKENYLPDNGHPKVPYTLTIMIKHPKGYDEKNGNWEYVQSDVNGNILLQGSAENKEINRQCADCHKNMAERDYVFSTYYSEDVQ